MHVIHVNIWLVINTITAPLPLDAFKPHSLNGAHPRVCVQVCLLDLDYNLPVQVRDTAMTEEGAELAVLPGSDVGKEYALQRMTEDGTLGAQFAKQQANDTILRLQRTGPYYKVWHTHMRFIYSNECYGKDMTGCYIIAFSSLDDK